jgi:hypothetical protein
MSRLHIAFTLCDADGWETECTVPAKHEVCPRCDGTGSHTNPSIDGNGITASEMDEAGDDFREDYLSGVYDVRCEQCRGLRVVLAPNLDAASPAQRDAWEAHQRVQAEIDRDDYSERMLRRMEGGW